MSRLAPPLEPWLRERDPAVKLGLALAVSTAVLPLTDPVTTSTLYLLALVATLLAVPARVVVRAHAAFAPFVVGIVVVNVLTRPGPSLTLAGLDVSRHGLAVGVALAARALLIATIALAVTRTSEPAATILSLRDRARLPAEAAYALLAASRVLAGLPAVWHSIRTAQASRLPRGGRGPRALGRAAFTLLVTSLRRSERMAISMQTRGLGTGPGAAAAPPPLTAGDRWLVVVVVLAGAVVVIVGALGGWLRGPGYLTG